MIVDSRRWRRRLITLPTTLLVTGLMGVFLPLGLVVTVVLDVLGRSRLARCRALLFLMLYFSAESVAILVSGALWLISWIGDTRPMLYAVQRGWASTLAMGLQVLFGLTHTVEGASSLRGGPLLLLLRHSSTADTLIPMTMVVSPFGYQPRYVLKRALLWDPALDLVGQRLPNAFVQRGKGATEVASVAALARNTTESSLVVIYPEGTRFTRNRLARRLAEMRDRDDPNLVQAEQFRHCLPPHSGGAMAVLDADSVMDVAFCAHVGFEGIRKITDLFSGVLINREITVKFWRVPRADIPENYEARRRWLFQQWLDVDEWIDAQDVVGN